MATITKAEFRRQVFLAALTGMCSRPSAWNGNVSEIMSQDLVDRAWLLADKSIKDSNII